MIFNRCALIVSSLLLSSTLLAGCYRPERVEAVQASDNAMDCQQIQDSIRYAEQARASAREHDKFEFRYMLVIPAFVSAYNFDQAEKAADRRKANLEQLYRAKDCTNQPQAVKAPQASPYGTGVAGVPGIPGLPTGIPGNTPYPTLMPSSGGAPGNPIPGQGLPANGFPPPASYYPPQGILGR